ncbi:MAG: TonB-dependent receptor domain-containing protein, partial [Terracidiphilus sp.]
RRVVLNGPTGTYGNMPAVYNDRQRQFGVFAQDTWRVLPNLTVSLGLRFEQQDPYDNLNDVYSVPVNYAASWGISGVGNWFMPGTMTGSSPTYTNIKNVAFAAPHSWAPSGGIAWQIPGASGPLGFLFGHHQGASVLRAGYGISTIREGSNVVRNMLGTNPGLTVDDSVSSSLWPQYFGNPGSVLFSQATLPSRPYPASPADPMAATAADHENAFDPNLKMGYVESWNIGFQREAGKNNVIEVRYTGNHGLKEWRQLNIDELNIFENGFLKESYVAQQNLTIARGGNINNNTSVVNYSDQGLPGQQPTPILSATVGTNTTTYATYLRQNRMASIAAAIYQNTTYMGNLLKAGYPANMFDVNPSVTSSWLLTNLGESYYDAMQVEFRRRMASGLIFQASYVWSKSLANGSTIDENVDNQPLTFRNLGLSKAPPSFDIRHAIKYNWIYELPFGPGRHFLPSGNRVVMKILQGWQLNGVGRTQSGAPVSLGTRGYGMNNYDNGVVLQNMTTKQLQSMVSIYKTTGTNGQGLVWFLPQSVIQNSEAAFEAGGLSWSNLNTSAPYIGPQLAPYAFGQQVYLYSPWQNFFDVMLLKRVPIKEHATLELRVSALNVLNLTDFEFGTVTASSSTFGQTTTANRDISNAQNPGGRVIDIQAHFTF